MQIRMLLVAVLSLVFPATWPQSLGAQGLQTQPVLVVAAKMVARNTADVSGRASSDHPLTIGAGTTTYLMAGDAAAGHWCVIGASKDITPLRELLAKYVHVWKISTTPVKLDQGQAAFRLAWARYAGGNSTTPAASGETELALVEGQRYLLDFLRAPTDSSDCRADALVLDLEFDVRDDVVLADRLIRYDMWLVHTTPDGRRETRWIVTTARHGVEVPFGFAALRFPTAKLAPNQFEFDVTTRVEGDIRGRVNRDGTITLDLNAARRDGLERRGAAGGGPPAGAGQGRKHLQLAAGEVVEIALPARSGVSLSLATPDAQGLSSAARAQRGSAPTAAEPLKLVDGRLQVSFSEFFQGHQVSLLIQARPVQ